MRTLILASLLSGVVFSCALSQAQPLSTAFTYQGELLGSGSPVSGTYDFRFLLFDNISAGAQVGSTQCADNAAVAGGRFTVQLDFGAQFAGQQRFLEIQVRQDTGLSCANATGFTTLSPRQSLTAAPNAVYSLNAASATSAATATTATTAATATNATQLNGQAASFYQNAANLSTGVLGSAQLSGSYFNALALTNAGNAFTGSGAGLTSVNADLLDGLNSTAFLQSIPTPLTLSATSVSSHVIRADNASPTSFASGVLGVASALTGSTMGVEGASSSSDGTGVYGQATSSSGSTYGGAFVSVSPSGYGARGTGAVGVLGDSSSTSGRGVWGLSSNATGRGVFGTASATTGLSYGVYGQAASSTDNAAGIFGTATAGTGITFGVRGESSSPAGFGVMGYSALATGATTGVYGLADSSAGRGVFGSASASSGSTYGVYGLSSSTTGFGVFGSAPAATGVNHGVKGESQSISGRGVSGVALAQTGVAYGVFGQSFSQTDGAAGVYGSAASGLGITSGVYGRSDSYSGRGVVGVSTALSGWTYGLYGEINSISDNAAGLFGTALGGTGITFGVRGESSSPAGFGVFGYSALVSGAATGVCGRADSTTGRGVFGSANAATGVNYGLLGSANSPIGWGVYSLGNSGASGTKSFRIDHPADPANKYLLHYSAESPEVLNIYRGTVRLNEQGEAVVDLPAYFASINKDPSYTLTAVGSPMPLLHIASEISDDALAEGAIVESGQPIPPCSFSIAGGAPNAKVSWRIEALRNDRWVQRHGAPVEVEKESHEKGTYQHPALYNQPLERGMNYQPNQQAAPAAAPSPR